MLAKGYLLCTYFLLPELRTRCSFEKSFSQTRRKTISALLTSLSFMVSENEYPFTSQERFSFPYFETLGDLIVHNFFFQHACFQYEENL